MNLTKKIGIALCVLIACALVGYLIGAFMTNTFDTTRWSMRSKMSYLEGLGGASLFLCALLFEEYRRSKRSAK